MGWLIRLLESMKNKEGVVWAASSHVMGVPRNWHEDRHGEELLRLGESQYRVQRGKGEHSSKNSACDGRLIK